MAGRARLGAVTAMISLFRSVGAAAGAAVFGAIVYALMPSVDITTLAQAATEVPAASVTHAFHVAFIVAACAAATGAFVASRIPAVRLWQPRDAARAAQGKPRKSLS